MRVFGVVLQHWVVPFIVLIGHHGGVVAVDYGLSAVSVGFVHRIRSAFVGLDLGLPRGEECAQPRLHESRWAGVSYLWIVKYRTVPSSSCTVLFPPPGPWLPATTVLATLSSWLGRCPT